MDIRSIYISHYDKLYRYAFTILRDDDDARDAVQSVFSRLWEKKDEIKITTDAGSYLYRSVYNESLNIIAARQNRGKHHKQYTTENHEEEAPYAHEHALSDDEIGRRIESVMAQLPPQCKIVFLKSRIEDKKYAEIAAELGISIKTVEVHMGKALKIIRKAIGVFVVILCLVAYYREGFVK
ncbi:MAG: RNA polymerase sigma-70 factor [Bacteroidota bacterium]